MFQWEWKFVQQRLNTDFIWEVIADRLETTADKKSKGKIPGLTRSWQLLLIGEVWLNYVPKMYLVDAAVPLWSLLCL